MLLGVEPDKRQPLTGVPHHPVADGAGRQDRLLILELGLRVVAALDVGAAESGELDGLARGGEDGVSLAVISTVVFRTRASFICDAIVRFQIRS